MARKKPIGAFDDTVALDIPHTDAVEIVNGDDLLPQQPVIETAKRMARVVVTGVDEIPEEPRPSQADAVAAAFDRGATLNMPVAPATGPTPPKSTPVLKAKPTRSGRPAGAETIQPLFATGIIVLIAFIGPEWALPTEEETNALAVPLSNILARRIDLAAKMGKDANDTIAVVIAVLSYLVRVGPVAAGEIRARVATKHPEAGIIRPSGVEHSSGENSVDARSGAAASASAIASSDPISLIAKARDDGLRHLSEGSPVFAATASGMGN